MGHAPCSNWSFSISAHLMQIVDNPCAWGVASPKWAITVVATKMLSAALQMLSTDAVCASLGAKRRLNLCLGSSALYWLEQVFFFFYTSAGSILNSHLPHKALPELSLWRCTQRFPLKTVADCDGWKFGTPQPTNGPFGPIRRPSRPRSVTACTFLLVHWRECENACCKDPRTLFIWMDRLQKSF